METVEKLRPTNEENRKQKDSLDKLEARMGITYARNSNKKESRAALQSGSGFIKPEEGICATTTDNHVSMP